MKKTLEVLNDLKVSGVIDDYAIGGAMGAMFYGTICSTPSRNGGLRNEALDIGTV